MTSQINIIYRSTKSYLKASLLKKPAPISTLINITNACPKGCCYCDSWKYPPMYTPTEKILKLLKELDEAGVSRITFHGGDPLMHPDFGTIVRKARTYKFFISVSVRETLIKRHIEDFRYVDLVFVSFDGKEKAHDAHKGKGAFNDLIPAFHALKEDGITFQTTTVVTKTNQNDLDFILETAKQFDFQAHFQPLQFPVFRDVDHSTLNDPQKNPLKPLMLSKKKYAQVGRKLLQLKQEGANIATSKRIIQLVFVDWPNPARTYLSYQLNKSIKCWAGLLFNNIELSGEVVPCNHYNPHYLPGKASNVFEEGFANAIKKNIRDGSCETCMIPCYMELNAMFSLDFQTIFNWIPKVLINTITNRTGKKLNIP